MCASLVTVKHLSGKHFSIGRDSETKLIHSRLYWEKLLKMIQDGTIDPLKMVSHRVRLEDTDKVYYKFEEKADGMQKVFVQTKFSDAPAPGTPSLTVY